VLSGPGVKSFYYPKKALAIRFAYIIKIIYSKANDAKQSEPIIRIKQALDPADT